MPGVRPPCTNQPRGIRIALALQKILMSGCGKPASVQRGRYGTAVQARLFCWYACRDHLAHALRAPTTPDPEDRSTPFAHRTWSAGRALLGGFFIPLIYSLTSWLDFANYRWSPATKARVGSIGTALLGAAIWLFWRSHRDLGKNWSPSLEISAQQTLITHGVYRTIPHPMYASGWLLSLAQALLLQNWVAGPAGVVAFLPLYFIRVPREEQMMVDHFGDDYRSYAAQTGRIVPRLRG
jgi:protein-S-isoprenylcysteine O-methyltransferase Ste14